MGFGACASSTTETAVVVTEEEEEEPQLQWLVGAPVDDVTGKIAGQKKRVSEWASVSAS